MRYFISDLHFFHEALLTSMDQRAFASIEEMHAYMIRQWNARIKRNDEVIILGDFSMAKAKPTEEILRQLKGKKYLICGNHDRYIKDKTFDRTLFSGIADYLELNDDKRKVILCHYPIMCYNGQYRRDRHGKPKTYMLYGHVHNTHDELLVNAYGKMVRAQKKAYSGEGSEPEEIPCRMINCFCMFSDYIPLTLDEWIETDRRRREALYSASTE